MPISPLHLGPVTFANPLGLWALLGIPAVIAIHFIQQRFRIIRVSTLFLLENLKPIDVEGRKLDWIRNSAQLWLQILLVLFLSVLLSAPEWVIPGTVQRAVLVLDSSYSMAAFPLDSSAELKAKLDLISRRAERTEWVLRETDPAAGTRYAGMERRDLERAIAGWSSAPRIGSHPAAPALNDARRLAGNQAAIVFVTDHKQPVPEWIELFSIGGEVENWGLAGFRIIGGAGDPGFEVLVRNYSKNPAARSWWFESAGMAAGGAAAGSVKGQEQPLTLSPGGLTAIRGTFPNGVDALTVAISGDQFPLDDRLPVVRPAGKKLRIFGERGDLTKPFKKVIASIPDLERTQKEDEADVKLLVFSTQNDIPAAGRGVLFFTPEAGKEIVVPAQSVVADRNRLIDGLNWGSLVIGKSSPITLTDRDQPLLWSGSVPLLIHRHGEKLNLLIVNLDAVGSNVFQTPAFIVLLHRFFDSVRPEIEHFERGNFELRQPLRLKHRIEEDAPGSWTEEFTAAGADRASASAAPRTDSGAAAPLRAPALPGFFSIRRSNELILAGSAYFADVSESDFNGFGPADIGAESAPRLIAGHHSLSSIMPLLLLVLGLLLIITWLSTGKRIGGSAPNLQAARTK